MASYRIIRQKAKREVLEMIKKGDKASKIKMHLGLNYGLSGKLYEETKEELADLNLNE